MRDRANSMLASTSTSASSPEGIWFIDSGASNCMTSQQEWFRDTREPDRPGYVKIGDDTTHPFAMSAMSHLGKTTNKPSIKNVLHVPTHHEEAKLWSKACKSD